MLAQLRERARKFNRTRRGAETLLKHLAIAEIDGVDAAALAAVRRKIGEVVTKRLDDETARKTERSIRTTPFTITPALADELRSMIERIKSGEEKTIPFEVVRHEMLDDMAAELRKLARTYGRTGRGATHLLEYLAMAENEGANALVLSKIRRELGQRVMKRQTA